LLLNSPKGDVVDQKIYEEVITLGENQTVHKTLVYTPPSNITGGTYELWLSSSNEQSLPLAIASLGGIKLLGSKTETVEILPNSCYLIVNNERPVKKYTISEGVDIKNTETLIANCKVVNTFSKKIDVKPFFETHVRTMFGDVVNQIGGATTSVPIAVGTSTLSLELPKASQPHAYDVSMSLINSEANITSNAVVFHYILRGISGEIRNTLFDKPSYRKGDTAHLQILIDPSADSLYGPRYGADALIANQALDVSVLDNTRAVCGSMHNQLVQPNGGINKISILMTNECIGPTANVTLKSITTDSSSSTLLDSVDFDVTLITAPTDGVVQSNWIPLQTLIVIGGLILMVLLIIFYVRINKKIQ
jgi:hypothetical protein